MPERLLFSAEYVDGSNVKQALAVPADLVQIGVWLLGRIQQFDAGGFVCVGFSAGEGYRP